VPTPGSSNHLFTARFAGQRNVINMLRSGNVGLGGYLYNDRSGLIDRTGMQVSYAYHIWMQEHQLSFGISLTGFQMKVDERRMQFEEDYDPLMGQLNKALYVPDVNSGIHLWGPSYYPWGIVNPDASVGIEVRP
jgi:hypothetical protein